MSIRYICNFLFERVSMDEEGRVRNIRVTWLGVASVTCAFIIAAIALGFGASAYGQHKDYEKQQYLAAVCNTGYNSPALGLPSVCSGPTVPGVPLVKSDPDSPTVVKVRGINKGLGVGTENFGDTRIEIGVLLESNNSQIILSGNETIFVDVDITEPINEDGDITLQTCTVNLDPITDQLFLAKYASQSSLPSTGFEPADGVRLDKIIPLSNCQNATNLYISLPYAGHSLCAGFDYVCPNDGSLHASSMLSGFNNKLQSSNASIIIGGLANSIIGTGGIAGNQYTEIQKGMHSVSLSSGDGLFRGNNCGTGGGIFNTLSGNSNVCAGARRSEVLGNNSLLFSVNYGFISEMASESSIVGGEMHTISNVSIQRVSVVAGEQHFLSQSVQNSASIAGQSLNVLQNDTAVTQRVTTVQALRTSGIVETSVSNYTATASDAVIVCTGNIFGGTNVFLSSKLNDGQRLTIKNIGTGSIAVQSLNLPICHQVCLTPDTVSTGTIGGVIQVTKNAALGYIVETF